LTNTSTMEKCREQFKRRRQQDRLREVESFFKNFLQDAQEDDECLTTVSIQVMMTMKNVLGKMKKERMRKLCPICLEEMKEDLVILECGHLFHKTCQDRWMQSSNSCSVCRGQVTQEPLQPCTGCVQDVLRMPVKCLNKAMKIPHDVLHRKIHDDIMRHYIYFSC
jgi:hypothetical protein